MIRMGPRPEEAGEGLDLQAVRLLRAVLRRDTVGQSGRGKPTPVGAHTTVWFRDRGLWI